VKGPATDQIKADHYREQADNLRKLAALDSNEATRDALLDVARNYDRLSARFSPAVKAP
jgi:hypothetical protein